MLQKSDTNRHLWVDCARGLAILLVVYRHAVVGMSRSGIEVTPWMYNLQEVVFNFRMPVFFILSGMFLGKALRKKSTGDIVKDKVSTLLYPYLLWSGLVISLQILFPGYSNSKPGFEQYLSIISQPRAVAHFWYLLALLNTSILFLAASRIIKNDLLHFALALLLHYVSKLPSLQHFSMLTDLCYFYPFLVIGTVVGRFFLDANSGKTILNTKYLLWILPVFITGQYIWFFYGTLGQEFLLLYFLIILIGCYFFYLFSDFLTKFKELSWLIYLGKHSLYIYILHVFFISFSRSILIKTELTKNPGILLGISWICGVIMPVIAYNMLKEVGFRRMFTLKQQPGL